MVIPWHSELLLVLYMAEPPKTKSGIRLPYYYLLYPDETILLLDILFDPKFLILITYLDFHIFQAPVA